MIERPYALTRLAFARHPLPTGEGLAANISRPSPSPDSIFKQPQLRRPWFCGVGLPPYPSFVSPEGSGAPGRRFNTSAPCEARRVLGEARTPLRRSTQMACATCATCGDFCPRGRSSGHWAEDLRPLRVALALFASRLSPALPVPVQPLKAEPRSGPDGYPRPPGITVAKRDRRRRTRLHHQDASR